MKPPAAVIWKDLREGLATDERAQGTAAAAANLDIRMGNIREVAKEKGTVHLSTNSFSFLLALRSIHPPSLPTGLHPPWCLQGSPNSRPNRPGPAIFAADCRNRRACRLAAPEIPPFRLRGNGRRPGSRLQTPANRSVAAVSRPAAAVSRPTEVVHCEKVSKEVREYFQRELERDKKVTAQRAQEKLRKEKAAAEGNYPGGDEAYDEEAELQRALNQSRAEEEEEVHTSMEAVVVLGERVGNFIEADSWEKRKYHIAPSEVNPKRQRGQATGKGKQKEVEVLSDEETDDVMMVMIAMMVVAVVAAVAVLLAVAGAEACHLQTHLLENGWTDGLRLFTVLF
nr:unnamed protein product [Digitaria exilis]